jgi:putative membrane protein
VDDNRDLFDVLLAISATVVVLLALSGYLLATWRLGRRGDHWPVLRTLSCALACTGLVVAALMPLPGPAFTVHMIEHSIVGMAAPVLVALARPVTLMLRALPPDRARRVLLSLLHSRMASVAVFPPLAAVWDVGGLWVLYRTPLFATVHGDTVLHALVYVHVFTAGLMFAVAVTQLEPVGRRYSFPLRAASLVLAAAAHDVLSKSIYAAPPPDTAAMFDAADVRTGAQIMFYGGDVTEIMLAVALAWQWYLATGHAHARGRRARTSSDTPARDPALNRR